VRFNYVTYTPADSPEGRLRGYVKRAVVVRARDDPPAHRPRPDLHRARRAPARRGRPPAAAEAARQTPPAAL